MEFKDLIAAYFTDSKKNFKELMDGIYMAEHMPDIEKNIQQLINFHASIIENLKNAAPYRLGNSKGRDSK
ncbi:hypothetical protein NZ47_02790 [Anaerovibrio lipolyticus]|uniref:Uncharacterized protein n=1 Tax=Anaerovibrio lipolyticus TaxID=82374 RepID=A0A0B2K201_9FIRM|nr:hypothetical protein NZ47_02790 [Anaerovibrio lipolyticus]